MLLSNLMIRVLVKASGYFVNKPIKREFILDEETMAIELENGTQLKVGELPKDILESYFFEKFINKTDLVGRVLEAKFIKE